MLSLSLIFFLSTLTQLEIATLRSHILLAFCGCRGGALNRSQQLREVFAELKLVFGAKISAGELLRLATALIET
jgi:hypothetical protein